jgi:hypothetical protein
MTARAPSRAAIERALSRLNGFETTDLLARFLHGEGCQGRQGDVEQCPIAVWLHHRFGLADVDAWSLTAGEEDEVHVYSPTQGHLLDRVPLPPVSVRFMVDFDQGRFPQLIEGE